MINVLGDDDVRRVLAVVAHPDDIDFAAAGTVATWTDKGIDVTYLIVTDGDAGGFDPAVPRAEIAGIRRAEQTAAAKCVGVGDVRFLGYPDGRVEATIALRRDIARVIRQVRPDRVVIPNPERNLDRIYANHPDHRAVGGAALDAVYPDARNPFAHPELLEQERLEPHTVKEVWIMGGGSMTPDEVVDVTETAEKKLAALRHHRSQYQDWSQLEDRVRSWLKATAEANGLGEGHMAEAFQVVQTG